MKKKTKKGEMETTTETRSYMLRMLDGSGVEQTIQAASDAEALEAALDWAREGDYDIESTVWVRVRVWRDTAVDERELIDDVTAEIDPPAPKCSAAEHYWKSPIEIVGGIKENPGVWGHGGGVVIHEVCMHCGCARITDTWAQDDTGRQGLTSVSYDKTRWPEEVQR